MLNGSKMQLRGRAPARAGAGRPRQPHAPSPERPRAPRRAASAASRGKQRRGARWNIGRFVGTVAFFNNPADMVKGAIAAATKPLRDESPERPPAPYETWRGAADDTRPAVLVTGATGGVGSRVVSRLLQRGARVRALVRDVEKARSLLEGMPGTEGATLEVAAADLSQPATVRGELFDGVRAVVSCAAVKVQPKEGDVDRSKYFQGIKFYEPELASDTPKAVEYDGMQALLAATAEHLGQVDGKVLLSPDDGGMERWGALDDVVMGGCSESGLYAAPGAGPKDADAVVFSGAVSEDNNGGFASVRSKNYDTPLDLGGYEGLRITCKGDGQRYKLILRTSGAWDAVCYCVSLDTPKGEWATLDVPFDDFKPVFRARSAPNAPRLDASQVSSLQLMLSKFEYDGDLNPSFTPGRFALPIREVSAYLCRAARPRFVHVSSAGVTRPNRPGIDVDAEPPAVKMNDMLGGLLTWKLAGEDLVRASRVPHAVVRPCALTEEPGGMPVEVSQGDTIKGKIGRDDVADLCVALLASRAAVNATFEVKSTVPFSEPWTGPEEGAPQSNDWEAVLSAAEVRPGVTGKTIDGEYSGTRTEAELAARQPVGV